MKNLSLIFLIFSVASAAFAQAVADNLVWVEGGSFKDTKSNYYAKHQTAIPYAGKVVTVPGFYIGKYEVTQKEWTDVMGTNPSKFKGEHLPVESVSWYDCIEYCNQRSIKEGLKPYYNIDRSTKDPNNQNDIDNIKWVVTINAGANGYRLPTEEEWEYAASGGQLSKSTVYPGSNQVDAVAWFYKNSGDKPLDGFWNWHVIEANHSKTHPVGTKEPNELGLYDMAGNVREWCWNWFDESASIGNGPSGGREGRVWRGGGWMGGDFCCATAWRASFEASGKGADQGLRVARDK